MFNKPKPVGLNISCRFLGRAKKKQLVGTRVGRQGLTPEERKARERKYSEGIWDIPEVNVWREWRIMGCWARASFHPWKSFHWLMQILNKALPEWVCASVEISEAKTKIITVLNGLHWLTSLVSNVLWQCFILIIPSGDNCVISSIKLKHKSIQLVTSLMSCCLKTHTEI